MEVWDENGMVMYYDSNGAERGNNFGPPDKGPRMCHGKKIPSVKHGKFTCKRNLGGDGKKKGKGRKCNLSCDKGYKIKSKKGKKGKAKPGKDGVLKCAKKPSDGWKAKPGNLQCVK